MSTLVFRDAKLLVNGASLAGALNELNVEYSAEMLDATTFGATTRIMKGGLFNSKISGSGFFDAAIGTESVFFENVGVDDAILSVFPDGISEGSQSTGVGFAMKGVLSRFNLGADVGELLGVEFEIEPRGNNA